MPTNDERRAFAATLRVAAGNTAGLSDGEFVDIVEEIVLGGDVRMDPQDHNAEVLNRLADLIEPEERTCRSIGACGQGLLFSGQYDEEFDDYIPFGAYIHQLSCGHYVVTEELEPPCYCAYCGAKVIHDA